MYYLLPELLCMYVMSLYSKIFIHAHRYLYSEKLTASDVGYSCEVETSWK